MTRPIIGLLGKKRAGKDTVAARLVQEFGFVRYAFADPLKEAALDTDPLIPIWGGAHRLSVVVRVLGWERAKECGEVRRYLQAFGLSMRERVDPEIWLRSTMTRVAEEVSPVVITDVRFPNEADAIEGAGGVLVRIHRSSADHKDAHVSETALGERLCSFHIYNEGGLPELHAATTDLAGRVLGWWS